MDYISEIAGGDRGQYSPELSVASELPRAATCFPAPPPAPPYVQPPPGMRREGTSLNTKHVESSTNIDLC